LENFFGISDVLDALIPEDCGRSRDPIVPQGMSIDPAEVVEPDEIVDYKPVTEDCYRVTMHRTIPQGTAHLWSDMLGAQVNHDLVEGKTFVLYSAYLSERELNEALQ